MAGIRDRKAISLFFGMMFLLLSLFAAANQAFCEQDPLDTWHWRNPLPQGNDLNGIVYANGLYVAVGDAGTILTSKDRITWTTQTLVSGTDATKFALNAVTYGNGLFVAVGGTIWTSPDGATWTYRYTCPDGAFTAVAYGNGRFVAAGGTGGSLNPGGVPVLATSDNGTTWVDRSSTSGITSEPTKALIFANGRFVQVAWHQPFYYSTDGLTWTPGEPADSAAYSLYNHATDIAYGNGVFVVVGNSLDKDYGGSIFISEDGVTWTRMSGPPYFYNLCFGNNIFMGLGSDGAATPTYAAYTSADGVTWTTHPVGPAWGNRIAASPGSFTLVGTSGAIYTTTDGTTWTAGKTELKIQGTAAAYGKGTFVIVGSGGSIYTSPDGTTWTQRPDALLSGKNFKSVVYGKNGFVAAGSDENSGAPSVIKSSDGMSWYELTGAGALPYTAVAYGNKIYTGVGGSTVYSSSDGSTWTQRASDTNGLLNGVTFGNGTFMVVGDKTIMTSSDGISWTSRSSGTGSRLVSVAGGNNLFAAVGDDGTTIRVSTDGISWSDRASGVKGALESIAFGGGRFVAVGEQAVTIGDATKKYRWLSLSSDGQTWSSRLLGTTTGSSTVRYGNTTFMVVSGNTVIQSDALPVAPDPEPEPDPEPDPVPEPATPSSPSSDLPVASGSTADSGGGGGGGGGCFIATAAYGSDFAWQVNVFKNFRDRYLLTSRIGRMAVDFYYSISPPLAAVIADRPVLRSLTRLFLTPAAYGIRYPVHSGIFLVLCLLLFVFSRRKPEQG